MIRLMILLTTGVLSEPLSISEFVVVIFLSYFSDILFGTHVALFVCWLLLQGISDLKTRETDAYPDLIYALLCVPSLPAMVAISIFYVFTRKFENIAGDQAFVSIILLTFGLNMKSLIFLLLACAASLFFFDKRKWSDDYHTTPMVWGGTVVVPLVPALLKF